MSFSHFFEHALLKGKSSLKSSLERFTPTDNSLKLDSDFVYTPSETSLFTIFTIFEIPNYRGWYRHGEEKHTSEQTISRSVDRSRSRIDHSIDAPGPLETLIFPVFENAIPFERAHFKSIMKIHFALI